MVSLQRDSLSLQQKWAQAASNASGGKGGDAVRGGARLKAGDVSPGQALFTMKWVSGTTFGVDAAWDVPAPRMFPRGDDFAMDAPGKGLVNGGRCKFACGFCKKVTGHQASECPAKQWDEGGKRKVNFRWLFDNGKCDGKGQPC
jgi:hypothetical protein